MGANCLNSILEDAWADNQFVEWLEAGIRAAERGEVVSHPIASTVQQMLLEGKVPQFRSGGKHYEELTRAYFYTQRSRLEELFVETSWFKK